MDLQYLAYKCCASVVVIVSALVCSVAAVPVSRADSPVEAATPAQATPAASPPEDSSYRLGTGDKVRLIVYDEPDLSGEFQVDSVGFIRLPLIGQVRALGLSVKEFENQVTERLTQGYLKDPKVSVEVTLYRPFYIIGEVNKPGEYPYVNGMNALNAVALAGGYTYRAKRSKIYIRHFGSTEESEAPADGSAKVAPGDIIRIPERYF